MDNYQGDNTLETSEHRSTRRHWVLIVVVIFIAALALIVYLHRPISGTVIAVNSTSITIRQNGSATNRTLSVTSSTLMGLPKTKGGGGVVQKYKAGDIHDGETVLINVGPNNQAQAITLRKS